MAPGHMRTARLDLAPVAYEDAGELFPIFRDPGGWWYDPARRHRRHQGLATELTRAAHQAALQSDACVAVVAWVAVHNEPSHRVAERVGLVNRGPHVDPGDGAVRLAYTDRPFHAPD